MENHETPPADPARDPTEGISAEKSKSGVTVPDAAQVTLGGTCRPERKGMHGMMPARYCRRCGKELPPNASPRMAYCSDTCRKMASKRRRRDERAAAIHSQYKGIEAPRPKPLGDEEAGLLIAELESCALGLQAASEAASPKAAPVLMRVAAGVLSVLEAEGLHG